MAVSVSHFGDRFGFRECLIEWHLCDSNCRVFPVVHLDDFADFSEIWVIAVKRCIRPDNPSAGL